VRRRATAIALLAGLAAAGHAGQAAAATIKGEPSLKPGFRTSIPDYTVACRAGEPVRLTVHPPTAKPYVRLVKLAPGRAAAVRMRIEKRRRVYRIRCVPSDFPAWRTHRYATPQAGWYLLTPSKTEGAGYVVLFDSHGVPVWWLQRTPAPFAADLLPNGNLVWTNFVALSPVSDRFVEHTLTGQERRSFGTVGPSTNQHDFKLLPDGDALLITYPSRDHVDLSAFGGPKDAIVLDGEIQEVDPSGKLVWDWNTADHIALRESERWIRKQVAHPVIVNWDGRTVFDLAHVNSVEPDGKRLIFSARYFDAVYAIDRASGDVVWKLGGTQTPQSLTIANDPRSRGDFGGQHDARLSGGLLTLFDNGTERDRPPRALAFQLEIDKRRAQLVRAVRLAEAPESECCGSARLLPGRDWVVSWGNTPWVTEQTWRGDPVLAIELLPKEKELASYRAVPVMRGRLTRDRLAAAMRKVYGG
jgi:Arylsulfotransferase (ASST)